VPSLRSLKPLETEIQNIAVAVTASDLHHVSQNLLHCTAVWNAFNHGHNSVFHFGTKIFPNLPIQFQVAVNHVQRDAIFTLIYVTVARAWLLLLGFSFTFT
jgi:hypothetical protein